jgi:hypothetical protein
VDTLKLDFDLIREILIVIEDISDGSANFATDGIWEENFQNRCCLEVYRYHVKYLRDCGFIEPSGNSSCIIDITPRGREYLDNVRNDTIWSKTKEKVKPLGNVTIDVISEVAKSLALNYLGLR